LKKLVTWLASPVGFFNFDWLELLVKAYLLGINSD